MRDFEHFLFYTPHIEGEVAILDQTETHHAVGVLRLHKDDLLQITDGAGYIYICKFDKVDHQRLAATIIDKKSILRRDVDLSMFIGLPEKDAFEQILDNVVPLGVSRIVPVINRFCQKPWWEKGGWEKLGERFRSKLIVSMKQCHYPYLTHLDNPVTFPIACAMLRGKLLVADMNGKPLSCVLEKMSKPWQLSCMIGPPGGLSEDEITFVKGMHAEMIKVADTRLRTELATIVTCAQISGMSLR